jgi:hypothetical protein
MQETLRTSSAPATRRNRLIRPTGGSTVDISVAFVLASLHMQALNPNPEGYNQFNPGIAVIANDCYEIGFYKNSYSQATTFVTYSWGKGSWFKPFVGLVEGYQGHVPVFGKIAPAAGIGIDPWHKEGPIFTITPMNKNGVVIGFAWKEKIL